MQALSSPWDVVLYATPDLDMSVRPLLPPPPPLPGQTADKDKEKAKEDTKGKSPYYYIFPLFIQFIVQ